MMTSMDKMAQYTITPRLTNLDDHAATGEANKLVVGNGIKSTLSHPLLTTTK
jgi:hypothetical protein